MTETYQSVIDGKTVTGLLNCGNATLQFVNSLGLVESTLKGLIAIGVVKVITTLSAAFKASAIQASNFGTALNTVKNMSTMTKGTTDYTNALKTLKAVSIGLSETQLKQVLASKALSESDRIAILRTTGLTKAQAQAKLAQMGLTQSTNAQTAANGAATASTFSLTAAVKGFGASLKAAFMSNPVGIAIMALSTVIGMVTSAIDSANQEAEEARQKAKDAADTASTLSNEISELTGKYLTLSNAVQTDKSSKEDLMTVQEELIKKLGIEGETIDSLIAKYGSLDEAIKQVTLDELGNMENDLVAGVKAAEDELKEIGKDYEHFYSLTNRNLLSSSGEDAVRAYSVLNEAGIIDKGSYGTGGGSIVLTGDDSTVEGILENYQKLQDAMKALRESDEFTEEELKDNPVFLQIYNRVQEMREFVDGYNDAITDLNQNVAQQQMLSSLKGMELPDTEEEFNAFRDNLVKTAQSSNEFIGSQKDIEEAINGYLATVPQFAGYYGELSNAVENATETINQSTEDISTNKESLEDIIKQYPELIKKATVGKLDEDVLTSTDQYAELLLKVGLSADSSSSDVKKLVEQIQAVADNNLIDNLKAVSDDFESLGDVYNTLMNKGESLSIDNLDSVQNVFGDLDMFDEWVRKVTDAETSTEDLQQAFDDLATEYLNTSEIFQSFLAQLTEQNKEYYATQLQAMGVENYEEVISYAQALNEAKEVLSQSSLGFGDATQDEIESLIAEGAYLGLTADLILALYDAKVAEQAATLDTSADCENLIALAGDTDKTSRSIQLLTHLMDIYNGLESGAYDGNRLLREEALAEVDRIKKELEGLANGEAKGSPIEPTVKLGAKGRSSAKSAGKEAADTYLEAFEKELKDLDDLKDRGKITEKQYLDALRRLYLKYFRDKEKYLKEYEKYEHQYLDGMKSLYESAFSYITKQVGKRIDALNDEKDAAVSALEAERDARLEAIEAQKEQLENEIEGIEKKIDAKEKEIKAMQDANEERKKAVDLQKAEYEWQRMQNQKTANVYKDGQMVYGADTSGIRDAKQQVEDARLEIDISKIEKEIGLLEDQKGLLEEQIDLLDKQADQINKYYDNLIKQTESHYDAMIKGMEDYKSQFEELTDLLEDAQMEAALSELGINMDALLSGSQEEFEKLKTAYIGILADMGRGNEGVIDQLSRLSGISTQSISYLESTKDAFDGLGDVALGGLGESIDGIGESVGALSTSAGEASSAVSGMQTDVDKATQSVAPLNTELSSLKTLITELIGLLDGIKFPEIGDEGYAQKLKDIAQAFGEVASKCNEFKNIDFSSIIGTPEPGMDGDEMPSGDGMGGAAGTGFMGLAAAINEAVTSIGEQMGNLETALDKGNSHFKKQMAVINDEYIPAWEDLQTRLAEIIGVGSGGGDNKEGKGDKGAGSKSGNTEPGGNDGSIIDIMQTGGDAVDAKLEDPWLKAFNDFATDGDNSIQTICNKIIELVSEMARIIQEKCEAAASALNALAKTASSSLHSVGGSVSGNTIPSHAEGTVGDAFANGTGYKGLPHDEKNALRSEYGQAELTVYPDGKTELTTEPVMSDLPKDTVIFNEEQTKRIMENKGKELGNAYDDGTITLADGTEIRPLNPSDREYWLHKKFDEFFKKNKDAFLMPTNAMFKTAESVDKMVEVINNNHTMNREISVHIGDINLQGVQDVNSLSKEIVLRMPNMLLQEMHKV